MEGSDQGKRNFYAFITKTFEFFEKFLRQSVTQHIMRIEPLFTVQADHLLHLIRSCLH
ncbi:hypothetical protein D3C78_1636480 [compost metagenome]